MKKRITALTIAVVTLVASFSAYAYNPAQNLQEQGIIEGYDDGELHLEKTLTRAEFTKMFSDAFLKDESETGSDINFTDVSDDYWGYKYIAKAVKAGIISGFDDGTFRPEDIVTYEQAVTMIVNYLEKGNKKYPEEYVMSAIDKGITDSVKTLIGEKITRGDAVYLIDNTMNYQEDQKNAKAEQDALYFTKSTSFGGGGGASSGSNASSTGLVPPGTGIVVNPNSFTTSFNAPIPNPAESDSLLYNDKSGFFNAEEYTAEDENVFKNTFTSPLSTFSIDTDTASYSNLRRYVLGLGMLPPNGAIRTEELINYFDYDNPLPTDGTPFAVSTEVSKCPWNSENNLAMISVQGDELTEKQPSNLVFLLDVSGSMYTIEKLPLVKKSMKMLLDQLDENDTISIVTYASGTGVALESTPVSEKDKITQALDSLTAGGGTSGAAGITLAYEQAEKNLIDGNNRIILCTDGDFNIGDSSTGDLEKLITEKRNKGISLTVLGFGMGNYKDNRLETLADKGNGSYAYIDNEREAKKIFVDEMPKTLYTIAKDVKIQVEFNPERVKEYRLIGYENRVLNNEDFNNDNKDAGELGCGANVTAFYEIVPADGTEKNDLKYQTSELTGSNELMTVKIRYKDPDGTESKLLETPVDDIAANQTSDNFRFAAALAELGMILNDSEYKGSADMDSIISLAADSIGEDEFGFRTEFLHMVDLIRYIQEKTDTSDDFKISY